MKSRICTRTREVEGFGETKSVAFRGSRDAEMKREKLLQSEGTSGNYKSYRLTTLYTLGMEPQPFITRGARDNRATRMSCDHAHRLGHKTLFETLSMAGDGFFRTTRLMLSYTKTLI